MFIVPVLSEVFYQLYMLTTRKFPPVSFGHFPAYDIR